MTEDTIINENGASDEELVTVVGYEFPKDEKVCNNRTCNKGKEACNGIRQRLHNIRRCFASTYQKRNPVVNAVLSLVFLFVILVSYSCIKITFFFSWTFGLVELFCSMYFMYYMYQFVVRNKKDAFWYTWTGGVFAWTMMFYLFFLFIIAMEQTEETHSSNLLLLAVSLVYSVILNTLCAFLTWLVMQLKKYGATAWTLLDVPHERSCSKLERLSFGALFVVWLLPIGEFVYDDYKRNNPESLSPTHQTSKIGDNYYEDICLK